MTLLNATDTEDNKECYPIRHRELFNKLSNSEDTLVLKLKGYINQTGYGCPTVYEFETLIGDKFYFRERHGYFKLVLEEGHSLENVKPNTITNLLFNPIVALLHGTCETLQYNEEENFLALLRTHNIILEEDADDSDD